MAYVGCLKKVEEAFEMCSSKASFVFIKLDSSALKIRKCFVLKAPSDYKEKNKKKMPSTGHSTDIILETHEKRIFSCA